MDAENGEKIEVITRFFQCLLEDATERSLLRSPFAEHVFSRLQRSSALKSLPGVPLRSTPGFNLVAPSVLRIAVSLS
jgi:hypothetical protein